MTKTLLRTSNCCEFYMKRNCDFLLIKRQLAAGTETEWRVVAGVELMIV